MKFHLVEILLRNINSHKRHHIGITLWYCTPHTECMGGSFFLLVVTDLSLACTWQRIESPFVRSWFGKFVTVCVREQHLAHVSASCSYALGEFHPLSKIFQWGAIFAIVGISLKALLLRPLGCDLTQVCFETRWFWWAKKLPHHLFIKVYMRGIYAIEEKCY